MTTVCFTLPEGHHLMGLAGTPSKGGNTHWNAYVRRGALGEFRGGMGWTAQEAVDAAYKNLQAVKPAAREVVPGLQLNLGALKL